MGNLAKKFKQRLDQRRLWTVDRGLVVGVSGGPDSTVLALLLAKEEKSGRQVILAHVNYHLRGVDSDEDEKFCRELAAELKLPIEVADYPKEKEKGNDEERWRDFRYQFFARICDSRKIRQVAVGHTRDDVAETFLINLFRGSGIDGLISLQEISGYPLAQGSGRKIDLIRPLVFFDKKEILEYLDEIGQDYRSDRSNQDIQMTRNRTRLKVIPFLEKNYHANIKERIAETVDQLRGLSVLLGESAKKKYNMIVAKDFSSGKWSVDVEQYRNNSSLIRSRVFRRLMAGIRKDGKGMTSRHLTEWEKIIWSEKSKKQKLSFLGVRMERKGKIVEIVREK